MPLSRSIMMSVILAASAAGVVRPAAAQRRSQRGSVMQRVNRTDITLTYNRPVARGRTLFGGQVHWEEYWTPGANEATMIEISNDIRVAGRDLPAGRYSIWMIPRENGDWSWIFSNATDVWHVPHPSASREALRLPVTPHEGVHMEVLAFYFPEVDRRHATLRFHWGTTFVDLPVEVN